MNVGLTIVISTNYLRCQSKECRRLGARPSDINPCVELVRRIVVRICLDAE